MTKGTQTKGTGAKGKGLQLDGKDYYNVYKPVKQQKPVAQVKSEKGKK